MVDEEETMEGLNPKLIHFGDSVEQRQSDYRRTSHYLRTEARIPPEALNCRREDITLERSTQFVVGQRSHIV